VLLIVIASFFILTACSGQQEQNTVKLPEKAEQTIVKAIPGAKIVKVRQEKEDGREAFEVQVQAGEKTWEADVTADGQILDKEEIGGQKSAALLSRADAHPGLRRVAGPCHLAVRVQIVSHLRYHFAGHRARSAASF